MNSRRIVVVGGGAAGFFAAITAAETARGVSVTLLERGPQLLSKVRISGGGRCNVTHACFEPREFAARYPRGGQALIGAFQRFQARDTVAWFAARGVALKTESDGRMFPVTNSSATIVDCLERAARAAGVVIRTNCGVAAAQRIASGFELTLTDGQKLAADRLLLATGGCRALAAGQLGADFGHTIEPPVPSLFTFQIPVPWLNALAGASVPRAELRIPEIKWREAGPLLVTHWGLSGPVVLRLSAWGARQLHERNYQFKLQVNWLPEHNAESLAQEFQTRRQMQGAKLIGNAPVAPLSARLWAALVSAADVASETRWAALSRPQQLRLIEHLTRMELVVTGKSLNKDEFVTCGGIKLAEVNFKTMESRLCPGLYFAGELLDLDGLTGGFNFQAAWTTGWIAGQAMAS
jgi:hypothetical protein